jgi:hypothetical protein
MKVEMKMQLTGSRNGLRWPPAGEVVDLPDGEAVDLCSQGCAVPVVADEAEKRPASKRAEKR